MPLRTAVSTKGNAQWVGGTSGKVAVSGYCRFQPRAITIILVAWPRVTGFSGRNVPSE